MTFQEQIDEIRRQAEGLEAELESSLSMIRDDIESLHSRLDDLETALEEAQHSA